MTSLPAASVRNPFVPHRARVIHSLTPSKPGASDQGIKCTPHPSAQTKESLAINKTKTHVRQNGPFLPPRWWRNSWVLVESRPVIIAVFLRSFWGGKGDRGCFIETTTTTTTACRSVAQVPGKGGVPSLHENHNGS
ncbi:hypothetical protein LA080_009959 [Diaporthe eres]|nr:hypothetical protein LA080_009959 [Diaporthe eres]